MAVALPRWPLSLDDLAALPDDGHRYELIDGSLLVTPAPGAAHQLTLGNLYVTVRATLAEGLVPILAPYDYVISPSTVLQPDLLIVSADDVADKLMSTPLLVVEVLSTSTRRTDLGSKLLAYQEAGVPSYWVLDPTTATLSVHQLGSDRTYDATIIAPPHTWTDTQLGITVDPAALCRPPR